MTLARRISYGAVFIFGALVVWLDLGPALLAGLFSFLILKITHRAVFSWQLLRSLKADAADRAAGKIIPMQARLADTAMRAVAVGVFLVLASLLTWMFTEFIRLAVVRLPAILSVAIPKLDALVESYGLDLPFESLDQLRTMIGLKLKENSAALTLASGLVTRRFFQIFLVIFSAVSFFWNAKPAPESHSLYGALTRELGWRADVFMAGFEKIFGAQIAISFINMWVTVVFLRTMDFPYVPFLALTTFILGIIPIVGNLLSNTIIIGAALSVSPQAALIALGFLIASHKAEYFLNSRIIGSRIDTPMWQVLLGLLLGESLMGVPGVILAPVILHYVREELSAIPLEDSFAAHKQ